MNTEYVNLYDYYIMSKEEPLNTQQQEEKNSVKLKALLDGGFLNTNCLTVTGKTVKENFS